MGFDPGSPGSRPGPKAGAKPLRHPGIPRTLKIEIFFSCHTQARCHHDGRCVTTLKSVPRGFPLLPGAGLSRSSRLLVPGGVQERPPTPCTQVHTEEQQRGARAWKPRGQGGPAVWPRGETWSPMEDRGPGSTPCPCPGLGLGVPAIPAPTREREQVWVARPPVSLQVRPQPGLAVPAAPHVTTAWLAPSCPCPSGTPLPPLPCPQPSPVLPSSVPASTATCLRLCPR